MAPTLIITLGSFQSCLSVNSTPTIYTSTLISISLYRYIAFRIVNLYAHRKQDYQLQHSSCVQFLLLLVLQTPLTFSYSGLHLISPPHQVTYICNTFRLLLYILHLTLGSCNLLIYFFYLYALTCTLWCEILQVLTNA